MVDGDRTFSRASTGLDVSLYCVSERDVAAGGRGPYAVQVLRLQQGGFPLRFLLRGPGNGQGTTVQHEPDAPLPGGELCCRRCFHGYLHLTPRAAL